MKEASFYQPLADLKVRCELCPHNCLIADGRRGICGVRENRQGTLYSLVYGRVVAAAIDPIEKKPLYHFLPGTKTYSIATVGCNFRCDFCQNWEISQIRSKDEGRKTKDEKPEDVVAAAQENSCPSISYTYTEPTIYFEFAYDCAKLARESGLKNIFVTNGYMNPPVVEAIVPYLDAANIDLKSFREEFYHKYCGGKLAPVLETIRLMKQKGVWVELTTLIIPGLNDSDAELAEIAGFIVKEVGADTPWHVSAFRPTYKMIDRPPTPVETVLRAQAIGLKAGLKHVHPGNVRLPGSGVGR
ncbi:MAG: AmmeMemoRadiSam system radical SAM enzyme [Candidatus Margulisbacteria bacterium]|jgi:pyruvate formate lyase activating enzyme|nr:AmmeMemoRadiSam system radical SAM enzyme [Candidatus Margulisiibacteriota bacterium]